MKIHSLQVGGGVDGGGGDVGGGGGDVGGGVGFGGTETNRTVANYKQENIL